MGKKEKQGYGFGISEIGYSIIMDIDNEFEKARAWYKLKKDRKRIEDIILYLDNADSVLNWAQKVMSKDDVRINYNRFVKSV